MQINVTFDQSQSSLPAGFVSAIDYVVNLFDGLFPNNVTINIDVGYGEINGQPLGSNALGESEASQYVSASYASVKSALQAEGAPGAASLPASSPIASNLLISQAEAKALGLYPNNGSLDGWIGFSSSFPFSYTPNATPASNQYYFVGVAEHEISEVMGRVSDAGGMVMDLFRYSAPGVHSVSPNGSTAYFSIDNGTTNLGSWNNQDSNGDLGDWYPQGPGGNDAFNDYSSPGVVNALSSTDITLMQAIGWTATSGVVNAPTVASVSATTDSGANDLNAGHKVTIVLQTSEAVFVSGTPTLQLNDNEAATYSAGSGTDTITFRYTVQAGDNTPDLNVTGINLNSGTITDGAGNALSGSVQADLHIQVDTTAPTIVSIVASGIGITDGNGDLNAGKVVTFTVDMSEAVKVAGSTATLTLNDGGTASFDSAQSTSTALVFDYTIANGENTSDLTVISLNPNGSTIQDAAENNANLSGADDFNPVGTLQIDTTILESALPALQGLTTDEQQAEAMYVAYFGRAGDSTGTYFWMGNLDAGQSIDEVAMNFAKQIESQNLYPFLASPTTDSESARISFIDSIYQNLFNRAPDTAGQNYWDAELQRDQQTLTGNALSQAIGEFILEVIRGAQNTAAGQDITSIQNKVAVASYFTEQIAIHNVVYANNLPSVVDAQAHSVVANTTSSPTSVATQMATINGDVTSDVASGAQIAVLGITTSASHPV